MSNHRIALRPIAAVALATLALAAAQPATGQSAPGAARTQDSAELEALRSRLLDTERELDQLNRQLDELKGARASSKDLFVRGFSAAPAIGATLFSQARIGITVETDETPESGGVLVEEVVPDGPADRAGLEPGDVITHWNGRELGGPPRRAGAAGVLGGRSGSANQLLDLARALDPGDEVALRVRRNDDSLELTVVAERTPLLSAESFHVEPRPAVAAEMALEAARSAAPMIPGSNMGFAWAFGGRSLWGDVELVRVDAELGEYFDTEEGLLVLRTPEGDSFGLRAGDVILRIGEREPRDATHGLRILRSYDAGETVNLYVVRKGERITLTANVPAAEKTSFSWSPDGSKI